MKNSPKVFCLSLLLSARASRQAGDVPIIVWEALEVLPWVGSAWNVLKEKLPLSSPLLPNKNLPGPLEEVWLKSHQIPLYFIILSFDRDFCIVSGFLWDMKLLRRVFLNTVILDFNEILVMVQMKNLIQLWTLQNYMWKATEKACRKTVIATWKARFSH